MSDPWVVLVLTAVLVVNRFLLPAVLGRPGLFWTIQAFDALLAGAVAIWGLPGLAAYPMASWLVAGLLLFHVVQNLALRTQANNRAERERNEKERMRKLRALEPPRQFDPDPAEDGQPEE